MKNPAVYLQQVGLKSLGFDPGPLDGVSGPKTAAAWTDWQNSLHPANAGGTAARMLVLAKDELWVREKEGKNHGDGIAKYWPATTYPSGYADRQPYCAAFICWLVRQAAPKPCLFDLPTSPKAFAFEAWAKKQEGRGVELIGKSEAIEPGDIIVFEFSHVGLAEQRVGKGKTEVHTIDANTSPGSGDNEGGGNFRRTRARHLIRAIVRITV